MSNELILWIYLALLCIISIATIVALIIVPVKMKKKGKGKYILFAIIGILILSITLQKVLMFCVQEPIIELLKQLNEPGCFSPQNYESLQ